MPFGTEIIGLLEAAGGGTYGKTLFLGRRAAIPTGDGPFTTVIETGGATPERTHDDGASPAYQRPGAQIVVRAASYTVAMAAARAHYDTLVAVRNRLVDGVWYREITPLQEPFELDPDQNERAQVAFNVMAVKRPS